MTSFFLFPAILLAAGALWLIQGILWGKLWQKNLSVRIAFRQESAVEGDLAALTEEITNNKFLPLPALHVKFQTGRGLTFPEQNNTRTTDQNYRSDIFSCMPWQQIRRTLEFHCDRRGYYPINQVQLTGYDLLWSGVYTETVPLSAAMYVYPRLADPAALTLPLRRLAGEYTARRALIRDPFALASIRDYTWSDPIRTVNWKATARTGSLKVNVFAPASSWRVTILLDAAGYRLWDDPELKEETVRLCASFVDALTTQGIPTAIRTNAVDCVTGMPPYLSAGAGPEHLQATMQLLARLDMTSRPTQNDSGCHGQAPLSALTNDTNRHEQLLSCTTANQTRQTMESILEELVGEDSDPDFTLYILLSSNRSDSMAAAFQTLNLRSPGTQWILPLRPGETCTFCSDDIFPWEVPYGKT